MCAIDPYEQTLTGEETEHAALWKMTADEQFTIAGKVPVRVRAKVDDVKPGDIMMSAVLYDVADEPFGAFAVTGSVESEDITKGDGSTLNYDLVRWKQDQTTRKLISTGSIDLRNPEAGYEPATATKRAQPIEADTYYDYTIWLKPTYYTVQQGHRLELYLVPFLNYASYADSSARDYMLGRQGLDSSNIMNIRTDYSFTIQNAASSATLPLAEEKSHPGEEETEEQATPEDSGKAEEAKPQSQSQTQPGNPRPEKSSTTARPATTVRIATDTAQRTPNTGDSSLDLALLVMAAIFAAGLGLMRRR